MCGRYALGASAEDVAAEFGPLNDKLTSWQPLWSIAPTDVVPIVHERDGERTLDAARWDWSKPRSMGSGPLINARIEKLDTAFWRPAFRRRRCIVPLTGYYEWTGPKGAKQPHYLHSKGTKILAAAGLAWDVTIDGQPHRCVVIVTRRAQDAAGTVHDRMPALLDDDLRQAWLDPTPLTDPPAREQLLDAIDLSSQRLASSVSSRMVDRKVNSVQRINPADPRLIEPIL